MFSKFFFKILFNICPPTILFFFLFLKQLLLGNSSQLNLNIDINEKRNIHQSQAGH